LLEDKAPKPAVITLFLSYTESQKWPYQNRGSQ